MDTFAFDKFWATVAPLESSGNSSFVAPHYTTFFNMTQPKFLSTVPRDNVYRQFASLWFITVTPLPPAQTVVDGNSGCSESFFTLCLPRCHIISSLIERIWAIPSSLQTKFARKLHWLCIRCHKWPYSLHPGFLPKFEGSQSCISTQRNMDGGILSSNFLFFSSSPIVWSIGFIAVYTTRSFTKHFINPITNGSCQHRMRLTRSIL